VQFQDATRRNRKIGTAISGRGHNNKLTVPDIRATDRIWFENVTQVRREVVNVHGVERVFFVEELHEGFVHACSVEDVERVLSEIPEGDLAQLDALLFRQPTRKQNLLKPSWGRLTYYAELGVIGGGHLYEGAMITLEAQSPQRVMRWKRSLGPDDQLELDRLRADGHRVEDAGKDLRISSTLESLRATQLYRTLPHEVGHWVQYLQRVERPADAGIGDWSALRDAYFQLPGSQKEAFAHRYAREFMENRAPEG
jgi:hypothetical protein